MTSSNHVGIIIKSPSKVDVYNSRIEHICIEHNKNELVPLCYMVEWTNKKFIKPNCSLFIGLYFYI